MSVGRGAGNQGTRRGARGKGTSSNGAKRDVGKKTPSRQGTAKQNLSRQGTAKQDSSRQSAAKQGSTKRGVGKRSAIIEGRRATEEALAAGIPIRKAYVQAHTQKPEASFVSLVRKLDAAGIPIEEVPASYLSGLSAHGAHQGIVVEVAPYSYVSLKDVIRNAGEGNSLIVVLDHVTDEGNLGAIIRSCEVLGASGVVIPKTRAAGVGVGAYKTSAGAVLHVPIAQVSNIASAIDTLKDAGFWTIAASEHAEHPCWEAPLEGRVVLVMGSEERGVSRLVLEHCDEACLIPQQGRVESLNVAQATAVLVYEWVRKTTQHHGEPLRRVGGHS